MGSLKTEIRDFTYLNINPNFPETETKQVRILFGHSGRLRTFRREEKWFFFKTEWQMSEDQKMSGARIISKPTTTGDGCGSVEIEFPDGTVSTFHIHAEINEFIS
ncbi:MAG: hypothetical protein AAFO78_08175, partial [Pseudomonadota bacterium]